MPRFLPLAVVERRLPTTTEDLRVRTLKRLYLRRDTVDELIRALECYEREAVQRRPPGSCVPITAAARKCS
jgi:hypothetical protein